MVQPHRRQPERGRNLEQWRELNRHRIPELDEDQLRDVVNYVNSVYPALLADIFFDLESEWGQ